MAMCVKSSVNDSRYTIGDDNEGVAGCFSYFDGLVCWPSTPAGEQARVECFHIKAFAQALRQITENDGVDTGGQSGTFLVLFSYAIIDQIEKGLGSQISIDDVLGGMNISQ